MVNKLVAIEGDTVLAAMVVGNVVGRCMLCSIDDGIVEAETWR